MIELLHYSDQGILFRKDFKELLLLFLSNNIGRMLTILKNVDRMLTVSEAN